MPECFTPHFTPLSCNLHTWFFTQIQTSQGIQKINYRFLHLLFTPLEPKICFGALSKCTQMDILIIQMDHTCNPLPVLYSPIPRTLCSYGQLMNIFEGKYIYLHASDLSLFSLVLSFKHTTKALFGGTILSATKVETISNSL